MSDGTRDTHGTDGGGATPESLYEPARETTTGGSHEPTSDPTVRRALLYTGLVFGAGFLLGMLRVPLLVPRLGERAAELVEAPFMLAALVLAARHVSRRLPARRRRDLLSSGLLGLALMLAVECAAGWALRGQTPAQNISGRDPVAGAVFAALLLLFALMPWLLDAGPRRAASGDRP